MLRSPFAFFRSVAVPGLALALIAPSASAQDGEATASPSMMSDIIENAGLIGWLIVLLSVLALALVIEHFMSVKRDKLAPPHLIDEIEALFEEQKWQEAVDICEAEACFLTNVVSAGLGKLGHSFETMQISFDEMHEEEEIQLHQKIGWLSLVAAVAPMMGLLGTVNGMITTFGEIASKPSVKPNDLAAGIKGALVTTLLGLTVAIPVTAAYVFFKNRVITASLEIGAIVEDLFERFREKVK
ncbi:MAG: peptide transporter TolQ [Planctomycetes bacterium]|jgi:biopolymer transport protein ExbB|nr:peptide transporter TolQ [Planctomycetota bacterium]MDP6424515.1 MotA/TolQ/ExbB proton channel family protein [Planctomycetota bacterium]